MCFCGMADTDYYKINKLVGTTINNPKFIDLLKIENRKIVKYSIAVNECKVVIGHKEYLVIKDGVIKEFVNEKADTWDAVYFDESWGIKKLYKDMKKTDKSYPKAPKLETGKAVYVTKVVDGLNVDLRYRYTWVNTKNKKYRLELSNYAIRLADKKPKPGKTAPPPIVYKNILGENGSNLKYWICQNFSTRVSPQFIAENFLPIEIKKDYDEDPIFDKGDYYSHHYIAKGDYFLSLDASTLIRLENDTLKGIGFHPNQIQGDIFPGFNASTSYNNLKKMYGELDTYMRDEDEYYIRTKSLEVRFGYGGWDNLFRIVWINQYFSDTKLICSEEFPFKSHMEAYCFEGNCENGYGTKMSKLGVLSTGYWENGEPVDTHVEQYTYSVEKEEHHPSSELKIWLEGLREAEARKEAEWNERINNLEDIPENIKNQLHDNQYYYHELRYTKVEAGKWEHEFFKIPPECHIGVTAITEKDVTIDIEISYEGFIDYNQLENEYYAFARTKQYFADGEYTDAAVRIKIGNSFNSKKKFPVVLYFYKRKR